MAKSLQEIYEKLEQERILRKNQEMEREQELYKLKEAQRKEYLRISRIYESISFNPSAAASSGGGNNISTSCGGCLEFGYQDSLYRYLTVSSNEDFNILSNDFTIEWFQYQKQGSANPRIFQFGPWTPSGNPLGISIEQDGTYFYFWKGDAGNPDPIIIPSVYERWIYFAICRVNGTTRIYLDGEKIFETNDVYSLDVTGIDMSIGADPDWISLSYFTGGLTNLHIVNGTGLYTTDSISIPTSAIQRVDNTIFLLSVTDESNFITDSSGTGKIITNTPIDPQNADVIWNTSNPCGVFTSTIISPPPTADFYIKEGSFPHHGIIGDGIIFMNNSTGFSLDFQWIFDGGTPSTSVDQYVWVQYLEVGTFSVSLQVTNEYGTDTLTIPEAIIIESTP